MNTDNKQTQEICQVNEAGQIELGNVTIGELYCEDRELWRDEEQSANAALIAEAFNTKALTGKGPKELWEENKEVYLENTKLKLANKQLSERVKELEEILSMVANSANGSREMIAARLEARKALNK